MEETAVETPKKRRGWPPGKKRGPRKPAVEVSPSPARVPTFTAAPEPEAPIHVSLLLKNGATREFGCAEHTVENGFHVFKYPSERDRWRETRREVAISEVVEIEITAARGQATVETMTRAVYTPQPVMALPPPGPRIHSVKQNAANIMSQLEMSKGPIKMDRIPALSFGEEAPPGLLTGQAD